MIRASPVMGRTRHVVVKSRRVPAGAICGFSAANDLPGVISFMGPISWFLLFVAVSLLCCLLAPWRGHPRSNEASLQPVSGLHRAVPDERRRRASAAGLRHLA